MQMRRGLSNPKHLFLNKFNVLFRKQQPATLLENEAKKMEDKLNSLKMAMNKEKNQKEDKQYLNAYIQLLCQKDHEIEWYKMENINSRITIKKNMSNFANKVQEKKNSTTAKQQNIQKPLGKPSALKTTGNITNEQPKIQNTILKRPSIVGGSRPSSTQSQRSVQMKQGKENENNLNSSFRKPLNQSFDHQQDSQMYQTTSQTTTDQDEGQRVKSQNSLLNSKQDLQEEKNVPRKIIQKKNNEQSTQKTDNTSNKTSTAESNLTKHINQQKSLQNEIIQFLSSINLPQYKEIFEENGFDDLDTILELNDELLNSMQIPAGHKIKIQKRIDAIKKENMQVEEKEDETSQSSKAKNGYQPIEKRTDLEELEPPQEDLDQYDSNYKFSSQKTTSSNSSTNGVNSGSLLQGTFNEEESHKSFLEALMEYRNQGKKEISTPSNGNDDNSRANLSTAERKKSVRFADGVVDNEREHTVRMAKKGKNDEYSPKNDTPTDEGAMRGFARDLIKQLTQDNSNNNIDTLSKLAKLYSEDTNSEWTNEQYPYSIDTSNSTESYTLIQKKDQDRISCWNCYKLITKGTEIEFNSKNFCSTDCESIYKQLSYVTCPCKKIKLKDECQLSKGKWFCSEICALDQKYSPENVNQQNEDEESQKDIEESEEIDNESNPDEDEIDLDLGNNNPMTEQKVLTLAQLESKYKGMRDVSPQKKQQNKQKRANN